MGVTVKAAAIAFIGIVALMRGAVWFGLTLVAVAGLLVAVWAVPRRRDAERLRRWQSRR